MACLTNGEVEHDAEQFTLVVVRDAALGTAVVVESLKPCVEARSFRRLCKACWTMLKLADLVANVPEILLFVGQARAKLDGFFNRAGHSFAEPQRARVVCSGVVDGFQCLGANALHIPEVEEFVRGDGVEGIKSPANRLGADVDRGGVSVFHAASPGPTREVIEERVGV